MKLKKFLLALLVSCLVLLIEFRLIPFVSKEIKVFRSSVYSPSLEIEKLKFDLVYVLKDAGFSILRGPFSKEDIGGIEITTLVEERQIKIIFSSKRDAWSQLASLQLILKEAKIIKALKEGAPPKLIDLTGDKPYVSF